MSDKCEDLQVTETINAPLNQLLIYVEQSDPKTLLQKDFKLLCLEAIIEDITYRLDDVGDWTFCNQKFKYTDALLGQITLTEKSRAFLYQYYDALSELRDELINIRKEHLLNHMDEYPEYNDLIYDFE